MPTLTLRPNAVGDVTELNPKDPPGGDNYTHVDEETHDEDTTYVYTAKGEDAGYDLYGLPNHTTESGTINSVKVYITCKTDDSGDGRVKIKTGGTEYEGGWEDLTGSWVTYDKTWTENPGNAHAWTWDEIDALQAGVEFAGEYGWCTQVYIEVDYSVIHEGVATLSGVGTLAGIGRGIFIGKATLSGVGTLAGIGRGIFVGKATLSGVGTLASIGSFLRFGKATLSGVGTLTGIGRGIFIGKATLSGAGTLAAIACRIFTGKATLSGTGTLAAIGQRICYGVITLTGVGTLIVRVILQPISNTGLRAMRQGESERVERKIFGQESYTGGGWW